MAPPTMDDVAERAGVSRSLVSLVMRGSPRVSDRSREKVLAAAAELSYRPNLWARNLASGRTEIVGVMLNDLHNPFFTEMAEGVAAAAGEAGMQILMNSGWQQEAGEVAAIEALLELRTDGVVLASPHLSLDVLTGFVGQVPTVIFGIYGDPSMCDTVNNDEDVGARLVVDHLVDLGHERIAHIDGLGAGGPERRAAFIDAMMAHRLAPIVVRGDFNEESGYEAAGPLMALTDRPTAIFAANDLAALGVLTWLDEAGIRVPDEVSVVGYDDTLLAGIPSMSLTTVHQPRREIGRLVMSMLLERIAGRTEPRHELVKPQLVIRSSTAEAP